ncbi:MAG: OmpA family protein [Planctomycetota bacterium]
MVWSRAVVLTALVVVIGAAGGCAAVPRSEYDALQNRHNELNGAYNELMLQVEDAKGAQERLEMQLRQANNRLSQCRQNAAQLEQQLQQARQRPAPESAPAPGPMGTPREEIAFNVDMLFDFASASLSAEGRKRVARAASQILKEYPDATVVVEGHTDNVAVTSGKWKDNLELSAERAMAVTRALIKAGVPAKRIRTVGAGETQPVASNATEAGRAKNRRVVIKVMR